MSYGGRRYGGRDYRPSPWESGSAPERSYGSRGDRYTDTASQLAAANAILTAVLQGNERGLKRRYDERDSYSYNRRQFTSSSSSSSYRRGTQRKGTFNRGRGSASSRGRKSAEKDKSSSGKKLKEDSEKKDGEEDEEKSDSEEKKEEGEEKTEEQTEKAHDKDWKFRCHLCRKSHETEEEHLEHLKTEDHLKTMTDQKARYKRQTQAIVYKLRKIEDMEERQGRGRHGFCTLCNVGFFGNIARHNFSRLHKDMRNLKAAYCRYCKIRFIERLQFDEHILTIKHMKLRTKMIEEGIDLNTETTEALDEDDDEETEDLDYPEVYNGEQALGQQCVRKVIGYFCKICCKFFTKEQCDMDTHCKNEEHFKNFVEHAKVRKEEIAKKKEELKQKEAEAAEKAEKIENGLDETTGDVTMEEVEEEEETVDEKELMGDDENGGEDDEEKEEEKEEVEEEKEEEEEEKEEEKEESPEPEVVTPTRGRGRGRGKGRGKRTSK